MDFDIGRVRFDGKKTVVIAEAGVNHLGRFDYAEELIKTAARAGADIVKFQTYKADRLATRDAPRFWNWEGENKQDGSQYDSYSLLDSFGPEQYRQLKALCDRYDVEFLSTPFDEEAVDLLVEVGSRGFKIASCDVTNLPFLDYVGRTKLPVLLSTGASTIPEIRRAVETMEKAGARGICIMHCTLCYPTDPKDSNLSALNDIAANLPGYILGLSDHTMGTIVPAASVLYGVRVIEKHYTFDKHLPLSADHWLSMDENQLKQLVDDVRVLEQAIGNGKKTLLECETPAHKYARRSIVAARPVPAGAVLSNDDLAIKRPGTGLPPEFFERLLGRRTTRALAADTLLTLEDVQ
ncbi:MAG: acetylneuraminic acid synthetase [Alphaproteobacteria bacterium]|nr:acetylneuraminic acid synthetase [Alphaproteobacteria bacterium]